MEPLAHAAQVRAAAVELAALGALLAAADLDNAELADVQVALERVTELQALLGPALHQLVAVPARAAVTDGELAGLTRPGDWEAIEASHEYKAVCVGVQAWLERHSGGKKRNDLRGLKGKGFANAVEDEIRAEVSKALGSQVGGCATRGVDMPKVHTDIKGTSPANPQTGLQVHHTSQLALGVPYHLAVVLYDWNGRTSTLTPHSLKFVPAWRTADHRVSVLAEALRVQVVAGTMSIGAALAELDRAWGVEPSDTLVRALLSDDEIPTGWLTLSRMNAYRAGYAVTLRDESTETPTETDSAA
jgi:hypothetical protein